MDGMTTIDASSQSPRRTLVAELQQRLDQETFPRVIVLIMLVVAGSASFLCSAGALDAGLESMARRYALATVGGYRRLPAPDSRVDRDSARLESRSWRSRRRRRECRRCTENVDPGSSGNLVDAASDGFEWSFDLDDLWWLALVALAAGAGLVAVALVVSSAPVLLAEVALDAALVGTVYRRLRHEDRSYWAMTALRQTWVSAALLVTFMTVLGFALQQLTPGGDSIGDVIRRLLAR